MLEVEEQAGSIALVYELIDLFTTDVRQRLAELTSAVRGAGRRERERIAHSIKGSCANLGAEHMAELAAAIERCPEAKAQELLRALLDEFSQLCAELAERYPKT